MALFLPVLCSCSAAMHAQSQCRHKAIFCASVMREHHPVRIVTGLNPQGVRHAQAQAHVNSKWEWLVMRGDEVYIGSREYAFTDTHLFTFNEYMGALTTIMPPKNPLISQEMALLGKSGSAR